MTTAHGDRFQFGGRGRSSTRGQRDRARAAYWVSAWGRRTVAADGAAHRIQLLRASRGGSWPGRPASGPAPMPSTGRSTRPSASASAGSPSGRVRATKLTSTARWLRTNVPSRKPGQHGGDDRPGRGLEQGQQRRRDGQAGQAHVDRRRRPAGRRAAGRAGARPARRRAVRRCARRGPGGRRRCGGGAAGPTSTSGDSRQPRRSTSCSHSSSRTGHSATMRRQRRAAAATGSIGRSSGAGGPARTGTGGSGSSAGPAGGDAGADGGQHPLRRRRGQGVGDDVGQRTGRRLGRVATVGAEQRHRDQLVPVVGDRHAALTNEGSARGPMSSARSARWTVSGTAPSTVHSTVTAHGPARRRGQQRRPGPGASRHERQRAGVRR